MNELIKYANWVEINLDALEYNFKGIRNRLKPDVRMCMVIKANAYGHGSVELAKLYEELGSEFLAVARCQEGLELREHGIELPILNLGYTDELEFEDVIKNDISITVFDYETAKSLNSIAFSLNKVANIHIKLDTGMSRIGFLVDEKHLYDSVAEVIKISNLECINIQGVFTHFANADEKIKEFERIQFHRFKNAVQLLEKKNLKIEYIHCSNSAEILDTDEEFNMVRPGIVQYGIYPSNEIIKSVDVKPAITFKSKITNIKFLDAGISVGYGRTYFTTSKEKIVTIAAGYADGFLRGRSRPYVTINGVNCPIVGRICMDQCMVRIPKDLNVSVGDEVVLFGENGASISEIADSCSTIEHEILCNINRRVPRVYKRKGKIVNIVNYL